MRCTLVCLPLVVLAIGCGGADDDQRRAAPSATPSASLARDDPALAKQAVLRLDDFPPGWNAERGPQNLDDGCEPLEAAKRVATARESSPRFNAGQATLVQNVVYVFADTAAARTAFEATSAENTRSCYAEAITGAFRNQIGVELGDTTTAALPIDPVGDQHDAARVTLPITAEGVEADLIVDLVFVRVRRALSLSLFLNVSSPFDPALRAQLTAAVAQRLSGA